MFSVIISEKGGAERREGYDRTDITIGRVQGNDLVLPKGNVSKRHARVRYREGGFIVTDLGSTNGTYVNGRKIAQATIVREGDKIYIGDFVLRIEAGGGAARVASSPAPALEEAAPEAARPAPHEASVSEVSAAPKLADEAAVAPAAKPAAHPTPAAAVVEEGAAPRQPSLLSPPGPKSPAKPRGGGGIAPPAAGAAARRPAVLVAALLRRGAESSGPPPLSGIEPKTGDRHEVISHFPLEHDPDESMHFAVPAPPRVPSSPKPAGGASTGGKTLPVPGAQAAPRPGAPTAPGTSVNVPQPVAGAPRAAPARPTGEAATLATPSSPQQASGPQPASLERATSPSIGLAALGIPQPVRRATIDGGEELLHRDRGPRQRAGRRRLPPPDVRLPRRALRRSGAGRGAQGGADGARRPGRGDRRPRPARRRRPSR